MVQQTIAAINSSTNGFAIILIIIAIYLTIRMYRNFRGTKFKKSKVYRLPIIYLLLTFISLFILNPSILDIIAVLVFIVVGYFIGIWLSNLGLKFFEKNGETYYRRAPFILLLWLISYILRFSIEFLYPSNILFGLVTEMLLAVTSGMVLGEAVHIVKSHYKYKK
ncbi:MAG: hypothetical protein M1385_01470 [Candidatus Marsarchaeota archaeon]|nr:hypothetical protein [Candidatus Marsarchaeota archaeon]